MERVGGMRHKDFDNSAIIPGKERVSIRRKKGYRDKRAFSCAADWVEILRGIGTSRRWSTTVICSNRRQKIAVPRMFIIMPEQCADARAS